MQKQNRQSQVPTDPQNCRNKSAHMQAPAINCRSGLLNPIPDKQSPHQRRRHLPHGLTLLPAGRVIPVLLFRCSGQDGRCRRHSGTAACENGMPENGIRVPAIALQSWHQAPVSAPALATMSSCIYVYVERQGLKPKHCQGTSSPGTGACATRWQVSCKLCRPACLHSVTSLQGICQC